jgi:hypothetical protein
MRLTLLIPCLFAVALAGSLPRAGAEEKPAPVCLSYDHAGLTEITVKDGKLRYVWYTVRKWDDGQEVALRGSLESYDRHQVDVWLTDKELRRFQRWIARLKVFGFDKDYPSSSAGRGHSRTFRRRLTVTQVCVHDPT